MGLFKKNCGSYSIDYPIKAQAPNPSVFTILKMETVGKHLVVKIHYPGCLNFEGDKICLFTYTTSDEILKRKELDPHFAKNAIAPFARFVPTQEGWNAAIKLAKLL